MHSKLKTHSKVDSLANGCLIQLFLCRWLRFIIPSTVTVAGEALNAMTLVSANVKGICNVCSSYNNG